MSEATQKLPDRPSELFAAPEVARFLAGRFMARKPACLLRYGDTGGRIMARPEVSTPEFAYFRNYLGRTVTPEQIDWLGKRIAASVSCADVIGLRSDLLGPALPEDFHETPAEKILGRLVSLYPIRRFEVEKLDPDGARRLSETRRLMERMKLPAKAMLTNAWVHVGLLDSGFIFALLNEAPTCAIVTSSVRRTLLKQLVGSMGQKLRVFECPAYPSRERAWGGDHEFWWSRWLHLTENMRPSYVGEPLFISAGIWTKVIAPEWARHGGIAIDAGSVMDFLGSEATRPAVLATLYDDPAKVPAHLTVESQLKNAPALSEFL